MSEIVKDALASMDGPIKAGNVEIEVTPDFPEIYVDRPRIFEVMQNLIENAIKYMGLQGNPKISIGWEKQGEDYLFFVQDNGSGIEKSYHETIFGLFNKLDAHTEGTGIGLALVRRIIEFHGGRIWVESEGIGKGSRFCFTLGGKGMQHDSNNKMTS
jgi:light-regulated signal transduction histidine kinase (bacteriophytochrome)